MIQINELLYLDSILKQSFEGTDFFYKDWVHDFISSGGREIAYFFI